MTSHYLKVKESPDFFFFFLHNVANLRVCLIICQTIPLLKFLVHLTFWKQNHNQLGDYNVFGLLAILNIMDG